MVRLRTRPNGNLSEDLTAQIDEEIWKKSGGKLSYKELADKLLSAKLSRGSEAKLKELEGIPWPLGIRSMHHWSSKSVKNSKRDIPKHALMALVETLVVKEYRPTLLRRSTAARFLRTRVLKILNCGLKKPIGRAQLQGQGHVKWAYPDGIEWEQQELAPHTDAGELLFDHSCTVDAKRGGQEVVGLLNRILKHKAALIKPGDPTYANVVAPEVADGVRNLLGVSGQSFWLQLY